MNGERPRTDDRDPSSVVHGMVERVLALAETWPAWDGRPRAIDDREHTPHKAIRRVADHLIDHLAQVEARLAGTESLPDRWHGSYMTTDADMAPFTPADLDEARSRLLRLTQIWGIRLGSVSDEDMDRSTDQSWSIREIAFHVAESSYYAEGVSDLSRHEGKA
jgi:hypothetical protein